MARPRVAAAVRRQVSARAGGRCEYCLLHQDDSPFTHQVDHIVPIKHGGSSTSDNLALTCLECNRRKGADLAGIDPLESSIIPLFNPRQDSWDEHFTLDGASIAGQTPKGRATVETLRLNDRRRILQRQALIDAGRYPVEA
jgi:hypothetical protein